jgi:hypothetical protein
MAQTTAPQRKTSRTLNLKPALDLRGQFSYRYKIEGTIIFPYILIIEFFGQKIVREKVLDRRAAGINLLLISSGIKI